MIDKVRFWVEEILEANRRDHTTAQVGRWATSAARSAAPARSPWR